MQVIKGLAALVGLAVLAGCGSHLLMAAVPPGELATRCVAERLGLLLLMCSLTAVQIGGLFVAAVGAVMATHQYATEGRVG
jgi:hypothetical protein